MSDLDSVARYGRWFISTLNRLWPVVLSLGLGWAVQWLRLPQLSPAEGVRALIAVAIVSLPSVFGRLLDWRWRRWTAGIVILAALVGFVWLRGALAAGGGSWTIGVRNSYRPLLAALYGFIFGPIAWLVAVPIRKSRVDFVILTPLPEERDAVLRRMPKVRRLPPVPDDIRVYYAGKHLVTFADRAKSWYSVVILPLIDMGRVEAANATSDAIRRWHPRYVILVGIAGGLAKSGVRLGDVLVADQIADYERQKLHSAGPAIRWQVHRVDPRVLGAAKNLSDDDWISRIDEARPLPGKPMCHFGPICTGDKVIANGLAESYRDVWTKLIGVEMEAGGAASAAFQAAHAPGFFMVRGVSDLADPDKDEGSVQSWRTYACDVAAAYTVRLLESGPVHLSSQA
jgi:nucleoside phosphorylase